MRIDDLSIFHRATNSTGCLYLNKGTKQTRRHRSTRDNQLALRRRLPNSELHNVVRPRTSPITMASVLITGASRGFGLGLARELASRPAASISKVFATARGDSPALDELAQKSPDRVVLVNLDVTNQDSIKKAAAEVESKLGGKGLDILINNAGVCQYAFEGVTSM